MPIFTKAHYLSVYNIVCAAVRVSLLLYAARVWYAEGHGAVWGKLNLIVRWAEALTVAEVIHATLKIVPASPLTTALQVSGRNTVVWAITRNYPNVAARELAYTLMVTAWNSADAIRYLYFSVGASGNLGAFLLWLRYKDYLLIS